MSKIKSTASASAPSPSGSDPWALAAGMAAPWRTTQYRIDPVAKMLHLWITRHPQPEALAKKRSWLGLFGTASAPAAAPAPAQGPSPSSASEARCTDARARLCCTTRAR